MSYEIIETEVENTDLIEAIESEVELYDESELDTMHDESLNEGGTVTCGGQEFEPSRVLEELDPTAYQCSRSDFEDSIQETEIKYICPVCGAEDFEDEEEAKFCCQEEYITKYDVNGEIFDTESEANYYLETLED